MVSIFVSVMTGIGVLMPSQGLAVVLVCLGVWLVTKSRSRADSAAESDLQKPGIGQTQIKRWSDSCCWLSRPRCLKPPCIAMNLIS